MPPTSRAPATCWWPGDETPISTIPSTTAAPGPQGRTSLGLTAVSFMSIWLPSPAAIRSRSPQSTSTTTSASFSPCGTAAAGMARTSTTFAVTPVTSTTPGWLVIREPRGRPWAGSAAAPARKRSWSIRIPMRRMSAKSTGRNGIAQPTPGTSRPTSTYPQSAPRFDRSSSSLLLTTASSWPSSRTAREISTPPLTTARHGP